MEAPLEPWSREGVRAASTVVLEFVSANVVIQWLRTATKTSKRRSGEEEEQEEEEEGASRRRKEIEEHERGEQQEQDQT
eukprot:2027056-Pyramimonas_sp.AAC.1